jgi:hypothetical protein
MFGDGPEVNTKVCGTNHKCAKGRRWGLFQCLLMGSSQRQFYKRYGTCGKALFGEEGWTIPLENMHLNIHVQKP